MTKLLDPLNPILKLLSNTLMNVNRAYPILNIGDEKLFSHSLFDILTLGLPVRVNGSVSISTYDWDLAGLAIAKQKARRASWEITRLFLNSNNQFILYDLLDRICHKVASKGAERIFLRLLQNDPFIEIARRAGFFPYNLEVLYKLSHSDMGRTPKQAESFMNIPPLLFHTRSQADDYSLFDLYNKITPRELRRLFGLTFSQWEASQEKPASKSQEFVFTKNDQTVAWMKSAITSNKGYIEIIGVGEDVWQYQEILSIGMQELMSIRLVCCLVPEHQCTLRNVLKSNGFQEYTAYVNLVKVIPVEVGEKKRLATTVRSI